MPVLVDDGRTVVEASVIVEHLGLHHPGPVRLIPDDPHAALDVRMMDRFFDNYVMTPMQKIVLDALRDPETPRSPGGRRGTRAPRDGLWVARRHDGEAEMGGERGLQPRRLRRRPVAVLRRLGTADRRRVRQSRRIDGGCSPARRSHAPWTRRGRIARTFRPARRIATEQSATKRLRYAVIGITSMRNQEVAHDTIASRRPSRSRRRCARVACADRSSRVRHVVPRAARRAVRAGQAARGQITYPGYEHLRMEVVVQKMEPERLFSFTWHPYAIDPDVDYSQEPPTLVEFTLEPTANGTLLRVVESGFDKIPANRRDEAFRMNEGGWAAQMRNIARHVDKRPSKRAALKTRASVFAALGDETRLAVLAKLLGGEPQSIARLTEGTHLTRQAVTKHLRVLEDAGVVRSARRAREPVRAGAAADRRCARLSRPHRAAVGRRARSSQIVRRGLGVRRITPAVRMAPPAVTLLGVLATTWCRAGPSSPSRKGCRYRASRSACRCCRPWFRADPSSPFA